MPGWVVTMADGASCIMQCSSNFATACRYYLPSPGVTQQTPAQSWLGTRNSRWQDTAIKRPNPPPVKRERVMKCNVCSGARLQILKQKQAIIHWPMRAAGWVLNSGGQTANYSPVSPATSHCSPSRASLVSVAASTLWFSTDFPAAGSRLLVHLNGWYKYVLWGSYTLHFTFIWKPHSHPLRTVHQETYYTSDTSLK